MSEDKNKQSIYNPHDAAFRSAFRDRELAKDFFRNYLPEKFTRHIDFNALEITDGTYVDEKLKDKHSDIVYKIRINGLTAFLYLLFEHQSTPNPMMVFRLLCYMVNLWKEYADQHPDEQRLPFVMPVVLYHGTKKWTSPMHFSEMFHDKKGKKVKKEKEDHSPWHRDFSVFIPDFTYELYDLSKYPDDMLMLGNSTAITAVLLIFKHIFDEDFNEHASRSLQFLAQSWNKQKMLKVLEILLCSIFHTWNGDNKVVKQYIDQEVQQFDNELLMEMAMLAAEQLKQEDRPQTSGHLYMPNLILGWHINYGYDNKNQL